MNINKKIFFHNYFLQCFVVILLLLISISFMPVSAKAAKKDSTPPKITMTLTDKVPTNGNVKLTIKVSDASGVKTVKWASKSRSNEYFRVNGKTITLKSGKAAVTIKENGVYTFYAMDNEKNTKIQKITVSNIDRTVPLLTVEKSTTEPTNKNITLNLTVEDDESGIALAKYLSGQKTEEDFAEKGTTVKLTAKGTGKITIKKNGDYSIFLQDKAGNVTIQMVSINNIDLTAPVLNPTYSVMSQVATVMVNATDEESGIKTIKYLKGTYKTDSEKWSTCKNIVDDLSSFTISAAGKYTIYAEDNAGNQSVATIQINMELKAVWISYLEFDKFKEYTYSEFKKYIDTIYNNCVKMNLNTVIVQVRPMGDAMYPSQYFPWSKYASGEQGLDPGYDPLEYMVTAAHKRNLEIHAWINPYRVSLSGTNPNTLSEDNLARSWSNDGITERFVLAYGGKLYYNPAIPEVQNLIADGVREIVENYAVDGIHFDDYFYPSLGSGYKKNFDNIEYNEYVEACKASGISPEDIPQWRRDNVSNMVQKVYRTVKEINPNCVFGISPAGNISNLLSTSSYYVDIKKWLSSSDYVDYICPQIYWSFEHPVAPYKTIVNEWNKIKVSETINMYIGLAAYRAGDSEKIAKGYTDVSWSKSDTILKRQVEYGRNTGAVDGYMLFRYESLLVPKAKKEVQNLISLFN
ncbi:glycoside hydrolase family 10 protein [Anaerosporobacter sp.]|uniref:glycoside hydrolase family 10 protein n=1 Tax=Anaerosporobacter sp. TaxID=1872529 RepID=UPI00286F537A|nr:family 10 glycosylhydrolase [Anaerosporobacter sp.]